MNADLTVIITLPSSLQRKGSSSSSSSDSSAEGIEGQDNKLTSTEAKDAIIDETPLPSIISEETEPVEGTTLGPVNNLDEHPLPPVIVEENEPVEETTPEALSNLGEPSLSPDIVEENEPLEKV